MKTKKALRALRNMPGVLFADRPGVQMPFGVEGSRHATKALSYGCADKKWGQHMRSPVLAAGKHDQTSVSWYVTPENLHTTLHWK